jgi:two-component system, response regulator
MIILSAGMSDISGLCLLDLMRAHPLTRTVPIILLSLESDVGTFRRHDQFDADAYVLKPWDFQRYCTLLQDCVQCWIPSALRPSGGRYSLPTQVTHAVAGFCCE